jgi:hypothetical protein
MLQSVADLEPQRCSRRGVADNLENVRLCENEGEWYEGSVGISIRLHRLPSCSVSIRRVVQLVDAHCRL